MRLFELIFNKKSIVTGLMSYGFLLSCVGQAPVELEEPLVLKKSSAKIAKKPEVNQPKVNWEARRREVFALVKSSGFDPGNFPDIGHMLDAMVAEQAWKYDEASQAWLSALQSTDGYLSSYIFKRWVRSYARSMDAKPQQAVLAKILGDLLAASPDISYVNRKELKKLENLGRYISRNAKDLVISEKFVPQRKVLALKDPPAVGTFPPDDPILNSTVDYLCHAPGWEKTAWKAWSDGLKGAVRDYLQANILRCQNKIGPAMELMAKTIQPLAKEKDSINLAMVLVKRYVRLLRINGHREKAAWKYLELLSLWKSEGLAPTKMDLEPHEFHIERANDTLWAARYRALIQDYETAKNLVFEAHKYIKKTKKKFRSHRGAIRDLNELKAEGFLILSNRIAVERRDYETAASYCLLGLEDTSLDSKWKDRFNWYSGLYYYIGDKKNLALSRFKKLFETTKEDSEKAKALFWIARTSRELDLESDWREYADKLITSYPLNFYSVVALRQMAGDEVPFWGEVFGNLSENRTKLKEYFAQHQIPRPIATNSNLRRLNERTIVLATLDISEWSSLVSKDLDRAVRRKISMSKNPATFVYLSRLHYFAGNYLHSISKTSLLSGEIDDFWKQYPEQIFVYFPKPFNSIYEREAERNMIDVENLYSISRQESAFSPRVESSAAALGLMQLIVPTASRYRNAANVSKENLREKLLIPSVNVAIGGRYLADLLNRYQSFEPAAYGAYNAGEYVVDKWQKTRVNEDPLVWVELVPFGETRKYIKNVWRNNEVYEFIARY